MTDVKWLISRFRAMSVPEILWRIQQKGLERLERKRFKNAQIGVCDEVFSREYKDLTFDSSAFGLNLSNNDYSLNEEIDLLGFDYEDYKGSWFAGFQTENKWPFVFSYELEYKQRDEIGDARTNWELNRHFQFVLLAKNYYVTKNQSFLEDFEDQFNSWTNQNPFLIGISWTSTMEFAIRAINWMFALAFLKDNAPSTLMDKLATGIINMIDYVDKHRSRYSSANNHLLVEAAAIGIAGFAFRYVPWKEKALNILSEELFRQNYSDGINKELSLHYQVFGMEAYALVAYFLIKNEDTIPASWIPMLKKQCEYVSNCRGTYGEVIVFGDDDEGKIIDLVGKGSDRYAYILQFFSCLLDERFDSMDQIDETIRWLFSEDAIEEAREKPLYDNSHSVCYAEGGNTILKSHDGRVLVGIDHAALGFGNIAAHGHADALSFQLFFEGKPVLIDPGTYVYHCDLPMRNQLRKTCNHNTVSINGNDQSQMLGAFLWGKKAECSLVNYIENADGGISLVTEQKGYSPAVHRRTFFFDGNKSLSVLDEVIGGDDCHIELSLCLIDASPVLIESENKTSLVLNDGAIQFSGRHDVVLSPLEYSPKYGMLCRGTKATVAFRENTVIRYEIKVGE